MSQSCAEYVHPRQHSINKHIPLYKYDLPLHAATGYIQRLIQKGYKVAIVEQMEDPTQAKGLVKRDVIKIVTPGTIMDEVQDEKAGAGCFSFISI